MRRTQSVKNTRLAELDRKNGLLSLAFDTSTIPGSSKVHYPLEIPLEQVLGRV